MDKDFILFKYGVLGMRWGHHKPKEPVQLQLPFRDAEGKLIREVRISNFKKGNISESEKFGAVKSSNTVYKVKIEGDGEGYWKGTEASDFILNDWWKEDMGDLVGCHQASREVMAHELDKIAGTNLVPETIFKEKENQLGSCQQEVEGFIPFSEVSDYEDSRQKFREVKAQEYINAHVFDELIGSTDRHNSNWGIDDNNNLKFIDNGLILSSNPMKAWNGNFNQCNQSKLRDNDIIDFDKYDKEIEHTRQIIKENFIKNEDKINQMFNKYHLSSSEKKAFWSRVKGK